MKEIARKEFVYDQAAPLRGIIAHLTQQCGGNVHEEGVVQVTASSVFDDEDYYEDEFAPEHAVEFESGWEFRSENEEGAWICYDFKGRRVTPTSYTIRSTGAFGMTRRGRLHSPHPKSWVLEVSNDGSEVSWKVVDSRNNNFDLNGGRVTRYFALGAPPSGSFRFVRLRLTGKNHQGNDYLAISALELVGALMYDDEEKR